MSDISTLHLGSEALLWLAVAVIAYFLSRLVSQNDREHTGATRRLDSMDRQIKSDEEILAIVNGKYISRRENDLMLKESDGAHAYITKQVEIVSKEVDKLREQWNGGIYDVLKTIARGLEGK